MSEGKLKTAVLGLNDQGLLLLEAASKIDHFQIQAVADKDSTLAERIASEYKCQAYDDYRQLITAMDSHSQSESAASSPGDNLCLLIAAGMYSCEKQVRTAISNLPSQTPADSPKAFSLFAGFCKKVPPNKSF
jgi:hypothetical protein